MLSRSPSHSQQVGSLQKDKSPLSRTSARVFLLRYRSSIGFHQSYRLSRYVASSSLSVLLRRVVLREGAKLGSDE